MPYHIIADPNFGFAALVALDPPIALGPVAQGDTADDAVQVLAEFVGLLGGDPAEMPFARLWDEWTNYVNAIVRVAEEQAELHAQGVPVEQLGPQTVETPAGDLVGAGSSEDAAAIAPLMAGEDPAAGLEPEGEKTVAPLDLDPVGTPEEHLAAAAEVASEAAAAPPAAEPAAADEIPCFICKGAREIDGPSGKMQCPVCDGAGVTNADGTSVTTNEETYQ